VSRWTSCKQKDFIHKLRRLGFDSLYSGSRHQYRSYETYRLAIPSHDESSVPQLRMMIREVELILDQSTSLE
jgi:predicted RNA binding protein YcfA (HicA-like mRNA interferase family)